MPSVDRIHRLLLLIELLQSGRIYNSNQLADHCGVSRRTIFRDLNTLQESGISLHYDEARQGYSLPVTMFLRPTCFNLNETLSLLVLCLELGDEQRGIPFLRPARSAALKLLSNLPPHLRDYVGKLSQSIAIRLGARNLVENSKPNYELLLQALSEKRQIRLQYQSRAEWKVISTALSPYRVLFNLRNWYVIGRSSLHRAVRTFNVGRIHKAELLDTPYQTPPRFSIDRYLGNAWSLIRERGRSYQVVVRFQKQVAYNVSEVRWHKTQKLIWNDDESLDFHVAIDGLSEIVWWILGYGSQAEVLEPPELREEIKTHIDALHKIYAPPRRRARKNTKK